MGNEALAALADIRASLDYIAQAKDHPTELIEAIDTAKRKVEAAQAQAIARDKGKEPEQTNAPKKEKAA